MDPMETCRAYNIPHFNCLVIDGYSVPEPLPDDWKASTKKLLRAVFSDFEFYLGFTPAGQPHQQLLLKFDTADALQRNTKPLKDEKCVIDQKTYKCMFVDRSTKHHVRSHSPDRNRSTQFLRRLKSFSGNPKPGPGEIDIHEWLMLAYEIEDNSNLSSEEKFRWLKNSLVKTAYTLVAASKITECSDLIELIALTFGASKSSDHLISQIYQDKQREKESPSLYLVRLQEMIMELERVAPKYLIDPDQFRLNQFLHGLRSADYDLIDLRLNLSCIKTDFPNFPQLLSDVQTLERDRKERNARGGKTSYVNSLQLKLEHEIEDDQLPGACAEDSAVLQELKLTNQKLTQLLTNNTAKSKTTPVKAEPTASVAAMEAKPKRPKNKPKKNITCWNCGEQGHALFNCTKEHDADKVREMVMAYKERMAKKPQTKHSENLK